MRALLRPTLIVTAFTLGAQAVALLGQTILARYLGTTAAADAFFAATTLPQYATSVLIGALSVVFIPVFMERRAKGNPGEAWRFSSGILNAAVVLLAGLAAIGMVFAEPLVRLTTPGLPDESIDLAARLSLVLWPSIVASGVVAVLTGLQQIEGRFAWSSVVPFVGAIANAVLLALLIPRYGVAGAAVATTLNLVLQAVLLANILRGSYVPALHLGDPGVLQIGRLIVPLVLSGIVIRSTLIIDRFLASDLPAGSISHLGYSFRIVTALGTAVSAGLGAVLFPPLADAIARGDLARFRETASKSLRAIWLVVAPLVTVGIALAAPGVQLLFERGAFSHTDSLAVARLLQIYLLALVAIGLATVTSRAIYALQETKLIAIVGAVEAVAYILYTFALARMWGTLGIAAGFVIYYTISIGWQGVYLRSATGNQGGGRVVRSLASTAAMALLAGAVAWSVASFLEPPVLRVALGATAAAGAYGGAIYLSKPDEATALVRAFRRRPLAP